MYTGKNRLHMRFEGIDKKQVTLKFLNKNMRSFLQKRNSRIMLDINISMSSAWFRCNFSSYLKII